MKKIALLILLFLGLCIEASSQVQVAWDGPVGIDIIFKRCYVKGNQCIVDFVIVNNTNKDISNFSTSHFASHPTAYDDEGNNYEYSISANQFNNSECMIGGKKLGEVISIPAGVSVKAHMVITSFDEYATMITLYRHDFGFMYNNSHMNAKRVEFRNIPVSRD